MKKITFSAAHLVQKLLVAIVLVLCSLNTYSISVTFRVDMAYQIKNGTFHHATDKVYVRGAFNNWDLSNPMVQESAGVYSSTITLNSSTWYEFKFFTDAVGFPNSGWEANVGAGRDNRIMSIVKNEDVDLGKVYFNKANLELRKSGSYYEFYCADPDTQYINRYASYLDENVPRIVNVLEATLTEKVKIWIYPDRKSFMLAYGSPVGPDWVGGTAFGHSDLVVLSPRIYSGGKIDEGLVGHEFAHAIVDCKKHSYVHAWLNEGAACYYGGEPAAIGLRMDGQIRDLINNKYHGVKPELSSIESWSFADNDGYPLSTSIADFIINSFGSSKFAQFIVDTDYSVLGFASKSEFQAAWHKFLDDVYLPPTPFVHLKIDLGYYISKGWFNPATDKVYIGGPFTSWFPYLLANQGNGIYSYTLPCVEYKSYEYKFKISTAGVANGGWEENAGIGANGNRVLQSTAIEQTLPTVMFNNTNPTLSLVSPNGNESFIAGDTVSIQWKFTTIPAIKIEYTIDEGTSWSMINASVNTTNLSITWKVPETVTSLAKVRITDTSNPSVNNVSDQSFSIVESNEVGGPFLPDDHTVALLHFENNLMNSSPHTGYGILNGQGSAFENNSPLKSGYSFNLDGDDYVTIPHSQALNLIGDWTLETWFKLNEYTEGPYLFFKPGDNDTYLSNYSLQIASWWDNVIFGFYFSQNSTRIGLSVPKPELNKWYHIAYIRDTQKSQLKLLLHDENFNLVSSQTLSYTETGALINSKPLEIGRGLKGYMDELRISNSIREFRTIKITTPNGGETLVGGSKANITWSCTDIANVNLEYSANNGSTWVSVATNLDAKTRSYIWTVPSTAAISCKIRISDANDTTLYDDSDQLFTISNAVTLALTKPTGGESWKAGSAQNITWNAGSSSKVKLEYSTNGGTSWVSIVENISALFESYPWLVPYDVSTNCKIRVSDQNNSMLTSVSEQPFSIVKPDTTGKVAVKFTVDMSYQIANGSFNASTDKVYLRGSFNGYELSDMMGKNNDNSYSVSLYLTPNTWIYFKFYSDSKAFSNNGWEIKPCIWNDDRALLISQKNLELPRIYFNNANMKLQSSSTYFNLYCDDVDLEYVDTITSYLNDNYKRIRSALEVGECLKVNLWFFPDQKTYFFYKGYPDSPTWSTGGAIGQDHVISFSPRYFSNLDDCLGTANHEFTHSTVACKMTKQVPSWLNEGAAMFYSGDVWIRPIDNIRYIVNTLKGGVKPPLSYIERDDFAEGNGYPLSQSVADFIFTVHGAHKLSEFIGNFDYSVLGYGSKEDFQIHWHLFLDNYYLAPQADVRMVVNMTYYISTGKFNPKTDKVSIGGEFSHGYTFQMFPHESGTYSFATSSPYNHDIQYKFKINSVDAANEGWEETVGAGTNGARTLKIGSANVSTSALYFNNLNPSLFLIKPKNGDSFIAGDSAIISWEYTTLTLCKLEYSLNDGELWHAIQDSVCTAEYSFIKWKVPAEASTNVRIRMVALADHSIKDERTAMKIVLPNPIGGPYVVDSKTVALLHFNNDYINESQPTKNGVPKNIISFEPNLALGLNQCVRIDNTQSNVFSNVEIPFYDELTLRNDWTVEFWFNVKSWGTGTVEFPFLLAKTGANYFVFLNPSTKTLRVGYDYEGGAEQLFLPNNSLVLNKWYHVAFIRNTANSTLKCLLHDSSKQLVASVSANYIASHAPKTNSDPIRLGGFSWGSNCQFDGYADELRISNVAREFRTLSLTSPNGGESLVGGSTVPITWSAKDILKVKLEYSTNNGSTWNSIISNFDASTGSYSWSVPVVASELVKVRISDQTDGNFFDTSDHQLSVVNLTNSSVYIQDSSAFFVNYPNPFINSTSIQFHLSISSFVTLKIFDLNGKQVGVLINEELNAGSHTKKWDASLLPKGVYICRLQYRNLFLTRKLVLL